MRAGLRPMYARRLGWPRGGGAEAARRRGGEGAGGCEEEGARRRGGGCEEEGGGRKEEVGGSNLQQRQGDGVDPGVRRRDGFAQQRRVEEDADVAFTWNASVFPRSRRVERIK